MPSLTVPARFNGPPRSGNGGWVAGALATHLPSPAPTGTRVTLRRPPPLEAPLAVVVDGDLARLEDDGALVAEAAAAPAAPTPVAPVSLADAEQAAARFAGHRNHPFPGCFVCGTARAEGDGLRLFAGPLAAAPAADPAADAPRRSATTWTPAPDVADLPGTWAALDCPGGWAIDLEGRPSVLGRMDVLVHRLPRPGAVHVLVGEARGAEGRKSFTAASLYALGEGTDRPELLATAQHVWIAIDPQEFS